MAMLAAAAIAAGILPQRNGRRRAVNKQRYGRHTVAHQPKTCVCLPYCMVTIFSNSSADLDQSGAFRLVFRLSQKAQPRTKPKSEVTQCYIIRYVFLCMQQW